MDADLALALRAAGHEDFVGDLCNEKAAQLRGDLSGCAALPTERWRRHCTTSIALSKRDPSLCSWVRDDQLARGRDALCLARAADRSVLCNAVAGAEDLAECMRMFKLVTLRAEFRAQLVMRELPHSAEADPRRGAVLLKKGAKRSYFLGDPSDLTWVAAAPLAGARLAVVIEDGVITKLVWRSPGEPVIVAEGDALKLTIGVFKAPIERGEPLHIDAEGLMHIGKLDLPVSFSLHSYLRDVVELPKVVPPSTLRPQS